MKTYKAKLNKVEFWIACQLKKIFLYILPDNIVMKKYIVMKKSLYIISFSFIMSLLFSCNEDANLMNFDAGNSQVTDHAGKTLSVNSFDISKDNIVSDEEAIQTASNHFISM